IDTWDHDHRQLFKVPIEDALQGVLERSGPEGPVALVVGVWEDPSDTPFDTEPLFRNLGRLGRLRALFLGDMTDEECGLSYITLADITPLLEAFPALEVFGVRGGQ